MTKSFSYIRRKAPKQNSSKGIWRDNLNYKILEELVRTAKKKGQIFI